MAHHAGEVLGRARLMTDASSGLEVGSPRGLLGDPRVRCSDPVEFDDPADWQWALDMWRSLAPG